MRLTGVCCTLLAVAFLHVEAEDDGPSWDTNLENTFADFEEKMSMRSTVIAELVEQVMINRFEAEERIRAEGDSGLVGVRNYATGSMNYHSFSYTSERDFAALHDHQLTSDGLGFGEVILAMNGVQFKTKHTDYRPHRPHTTSTDWQAVEKIEHPPVPPTVTGSIEDQIAELQEYFRAFRDGNSTHRDYKPYFKPILCYIEGAWLSELNSIDQGLEWENDYIAYEWPDLLNEARLDSLTGVPRWSAQKTASLPRTIVGTDANSNPIYAQWSYRVLCHPFTMDDLPTNTFHMVDDLQYRIPHDIPLEELFYHKGARFIVDENEDGPGFHETIPLLTRLISQIPGLDNVPSEELYSAQQVFGRDLNDPVETTVDIDMSFYNHIFYDENRDPFRQNLKLRGFGDAQVYVAMTAKEEVSAIPIHYKIKSGYDEIHLDKLRLSWMLPLEVVYLTPLHNWNPYDIFLHEGDPLKEPALSVKKRADGTKLTGSSDKPYNNSNLDHFMRTPSQFYDKKYQTYRTLGDDMWQFSFVLDQTGGAHNVTASGLTTVTPEIGNDVGMIRLRYPILPLHKEGDPIWKEFNAYKTFINKELQIVSETFFTAGEIN